MTVSSTNLVGAAGEALVRFDLLRRGVVVHSVSVGHCSYDFVADVGGRLFKLEVKTCGAPAVKQKPKRPGKGTGRHAAYHFSLAGKKGDPKRYDAVEVFAFVALDRKTVLYYPWCDVSRRANKKDIGATQFTDEESDASFDRCFRRTD